MCVRTCVVCHHHRRAPGWHCCLCAAGAGQREPSAGNLLRQQEPCQRFALSGTAAQRGAVLPARVPINTHAHAYARTHTHTHAPVGDMPLANTHAPALATTSRPSPPPTTHRHQASMALAASSRRARAARAASCATARASASWSGEWGLPEAIRTLLVVCFLSSR